MTASEEEACRDVVMSTFSINSTPVKVLFNFGASFSFIVHTTVKTLALIESKSISMPIIIPSRDTVNCSRRFLNASLKIGEGFFPSDLIEFNLSNLDVILGMDWLGKYRAKIDCDAHKVELRDPLGKRVSCRRIHREPGNKVINALQLKSYIDKGWPLFMCSVRRVEDDPFRPDDVPIVREFQDVFTEEIPSMFLTRDVKFIVDLVHGTALISKAPYRMAPAKINELKNQLEETTREGGY
ncbi:uncharacterized protein LOC109134894 [Beta vulgaris subsp. vulgaris]|uniref:uncharacterized protein LOC109134894 n=1 Tax=Beta vulgaris subsp. vulgaris TaxID=3555 RepID=UPI0009009EFB|nr:uncharacterized protein LOC109134894 [Beta vulgaris subsp. vulgaris]